MSVFANLAFDQINRIVKKERDQFGPDAGVRFRVSGFNTGDVTSWMDISRDDFIEIGDRLRQQREEEFKMSLTDRDLELVFANIDALQHIKEGHKIKALMAFRETNPMPIWEARAYVERVMGIVEETNS